MFQPLCGRSEGLLVGMLLIFKVLAAPIQFSCWRPYEVGVYRSGIQC